MPTRQTPFAFQLQGGYSSDSGPSSPFIQAQNGDVLIPWCTEARNITWTLDGWFQKMPGASRVNSAATGATDAVMGIVDYWRQGTTGTPVQKRVIYSGASIYKDDADGVWDSLKAGLETGKVPAFSVMNDELILSSTSNTDVPQAYDQTSIADLGGTPPNFAFSAEHKDRLWAAGAVANPSRLYYSRLGLHEDWTGAGSGSIDIFSDDGDQITGIYSHKDELLVFKGPNHGSIYRLIGSSPTGFAAFELIPFVRKVGCSAHQSIIGLGDDVVWWDQNGIHSLMATASFGDYNQGFLSKDIATAFQRDLNHDRFGFVWGQNFVNQGVALWTCSQTATTTNDLVIALDYRFKPARFMLWPAYAVASIGVVRDGTYGQIPWYGTYTGLVLRGNQANRSVDGAGYAASVAWPYVGFGNPFIDKVAIEGRVAFAPQDNTTFTVSWTRDQQSEQTASVSQAGTATLGASLNPFILDTSVLGGGSLQNAFFAMEGQFKELKIAFSQGTRELNTAVGWEPHGFGLMLEGAGVGHAGTAG